MGLTFDKILVILIIGLIIVGPERLPDYAKKLGEFVRSLRRMANGAKERMRDEMGSEFDEVDWKKLDPRQYDPRRIIRDALLDDEAEAAEAARSASQTRAGGAHVAAAAGVAHATAHAGQTGPHASRSAQAQTGASHMVSGTQTATMPGSAFAWDDEAT